MAEGAYSGELKRELGAGVQVGVEVRRFVKTGAHARQVLGGKGRF